MIRKGREPLVSDRPLAEGFWRMWRSRVLYLSALRWLKRHSVSLRWRWKVCRGSPLNFASRTLAKPGSTLYTDGHRAYCGMGEYRHEAVEHSVGEYVRAQAHTNGIESFWALPKRGYIGTLHHFRRNTWPAMWTNSQPAITGAIGTQWPISIKAFAILAAYWAIKF